MATHPHASASKRHVLSGVLFRGRSFFKNQAPCLSIPPAAERKSRKRPAPPPGGRRRSRVVCPFRFLSPPARGNGQRRQRSQNPQGQKTGNKTLKTGSVLHGRPNQAGQYLQDKKRFPGPSLADAENPHQQQRNDQQHRAPLPFLKRTAAARPSTSTIPPCSCAERRNGEAAGTAAPNDGNHVLTGVRRLGAQGFGLRREVILPCGRRRCQTSTHADGPPPKGGGPFIACAVIPAARTTASRTRRRSRGDRRLPKRGSGIRRSFPRRASP